MALRAEITTTRAVNSPLSSYVLSLAGNLQPNLSATPHQRASLAGPYHRVPLRWFLKELPSLVPHVVRFVSLRHFLETSPLRNSCRFWRPVVRLDKARRRRGFLLHTVTRLLRPQLPHYYGFICHLTPRQFPLEFPLEVAYRSHRPLGSVAGRCQASPVTALAPC